MNDIYAYTAVLPRAVNGFTTVNEDGDYIIIINDIKCPEKQQEALQHELEHINKGHIFDDIKLVGRCEHEAS